MSCLAPPASDSFNFGGKTSEGSRSSTPSTERQADGSCPDTLEGQRHVISAQPKDGALWSWGLSGRMWKVRTAGDYAQWQQGNPKPGSAQVSCSIIAWLWLSVWVTKIVGSCLQIRGNCGRSYLLMFKKYPKTKKHK